MAESRFNVVEQAGETEAGRGDRDRQKQSRERKVRGATDYLVDGVRFLLTLGAVAFVVVLADGARREFAEYGAHMVTFVPQVGIRSGEKTPPAKEGMSLAHKDVVTTQSKGTATLAFPDGSAVLVEPNTRFEVQLLDYNRGSKRDRSFLIRAGSVFTRISKNFGKRGQTLICTPNAVAAARGTGFRTTFDKNANRTFVEVIDGKVALRNAGGRIEIKAGQTGTAIGDSPPTLGVVSRTTALQNRFRSLAKWDATPTPLETFERGALATIDPALQLIALTPRGFTPGENDWSRRANTRQALKLLQQALEAVTGDVPDTLNPVTMRELGLDDAERARILDAFAGFSIDRYEKPGANRYRVVVRSRDSAGTVFQLTETGVREASR